MRIRTWGGASALLVVGGLVAGGAASTSAEAAVTPLVTLPTGALAAGARVVEIGWPTQAVEQSGGATGKVPTVMLAQTTTDANGRYSLPAVPLATLQKLTNPDGTVNVQTLVLGDGFEGMTSHPLSTSRLADAAARRTDDRVQLPSPAVRTFTVAPSLGSRVGTAAVPMDNSTTCSTSRVETYPKKLTVAGSTWSTTSNARQTFAYTDGASSSLGVGVSGSGKYGSYYAEGTHSSSSSYTEQFPQHAGAVLYHERTYVVPAKYRTDCHMSLPPTNWSTYFVQSRYVAGGQSEARLSSSWLPSANHCVPEVRGGRTYVTSSTAATHSAGFEVSDLIGISLSARSGWSRDVRLSVDWTGPARFCGTSSAPGDSSSHGELVARPR